MRATLIFLAVLNILTATALYYTMYTNNKKCVGTDHGEWTASLNTDASTTVVTVQENAHAAPVSNVNSDIKTPEMTADTESQSSMMSTTRTYDFNRCTVLVTTYKRNKLLEKVLKHLCSMSSNETTRIFSKIIVNWNNINTLAPDHLVSLPCSIPILFKYPKRNVLYNKFIHYPEIETQCVLIHDDDLLAPEKDLRLQFAAWQMFPEFIVGFLARGHLFSSTNNSKLSYFEGLKRGKIKDERYSMILTGLSMINVKYLDLFLTELPAEFLAYIDKNMNCEDIAMNLVVSAHLGKIEGRRMNSGIKVRLEGSIKMIEAQNGDGYSGLWHKKGHSSARSECLSLANKLYKGGIPLGYTNIEIVRTLYKL